VRGQRGPELLSGPDGHACRHAVGRRGGPRRASRMAVRLGAVAASCHRRAVWQLRSYGHARCHGQRQCHWAASATGTPRHQNSQRHSTVGTRPQLVTQPVRVTIRRTSLDGRHQTGAGARCWSDGPSRKIGQMHPDRENSSTPRHRAAQPRARSSVAARIPIRIPRRPGTTGQRVSAGRARDAPGIPIPTALTRARPNNVEGATSFRRRGTRHGVTNDPALVQQVAARRLSR